MADLQILTENSQGFGLLIDEWSDMLVESVENPTTKEKDFYIKGIYSEAEKKLKNPRIYSRQLLEREINRFNQNFINTGRGWGELKHPKSAEIDEDRISHIVTELTWNGNIVEGSSRILNTPKGLILKELARAGKPGVSTRGTGNVNQGTRYVMENYKLITWDAVVFPSADSVMELVYEKEDLLASANFKERDFNTFKQELRDGKWKSERKLLDAFIIERFNRMLQNS